MHDQIELRAFCSKHSEILENSTILPSGGSVAFRGDLSSADNVLAGTRHNLKIGSNNGDNIGICSDAGPDKFSHSDSHDEMLLDSQLDGLNTATSAGRTDEIDNASDSLGFALVLKKVFCIKSKFICMFSIKFNYHDVES